MPLEKIKRKNEDMLLTQSQLNSCFLLRVRKFSHPGTCLISSKRGPVGLAGLLLFPGLLPAHVEPVQERKAGSALAPSQCLLLAHFGLRGNLASLWGT